VQQEKIKQKDDEENTWSRYWIKTISII
jgi:hypothetical protein